MEIHKKSFKNLINPLNNKKQLNIFLTTNKNLYSFTHYLSQNNINELLQDTKSTLKNKKLLSYNTIKQINKTIYYINQQMIEFNSLDHIIELNKNIESNEIIRKSIKDINKEK